MHIEISSWLVFVIVAMFAYVAIGILIGAAYDFGDLIIVAIVYWPVIIAVSAWERIKRYYDEKDTRRPKSRNRKSKR